MKIIIDNGKLSPEASAMYQAFYSRDVGTSAETRIAEYTEQKDEEARSKLSRWYIGYGHKSIGDCGSFTIFIEGVSMLAAKAIQDSPLYNGQESSTRFIDFAKTGCYTPSPLECSSIGLSHEECYSLPVSFQDVNERWLALYEEVLAALKKRFTELYLGNGLSKDDAEAAANVRALDIARGFLPASGLTNLSWHTTFSHFNDHVQFLFEHPLKEVRDLAISLQEQAKALFPTAIKELRLKVQSDFSSHYRDDPNPEVRTTVHVNDWSLLNQVRVQDQTVKDYYGGIVPALDVGASVWVEGLLSFAEYRDFQRQRNGRYIMPLLTSRMGAHPFYVDGLKLVDGAQGKFEEIMATVGFLAATLYQNDDPAEKITTAHAIAQYLMPMCMAVKFSYSCSLAQALYILNLRTTPTVHPALREMMWQWAAGLKTSAAGLFLPMAAINYDPTNYVRRSTQTIKNVK
jgi:thymidylate synthase ThyX